MAKALDTGLLRPVAYIEQALIGGARGNSRGLICARGKLQCYWLALLSQQSLQIGKMDCTVTPDHPLTDEPTNRGVLERGTANGHVGLAADSTRTHLC